MSTNEPGRRPFGSDGRADRASASSQSERSRNQEQPCANDDDSDSSRDTFSCRREAFEGDGCRHARHRAQVHDAEDEQDRGQAGAAGDAIEAQADAVPARCDGVRAQAPPCPGTARQQASRCVFHTVNCNAPMTRTTAPAANGTARASAGCCISIVASAAPSGKAAAPNTVHTRK